MEQKLRVLDLGCGNKKRQGAIGVDFNERTSADIIHNLNRIPYPFDDCSFDEVYIDNTLEHLDDVILVMEEVHRVCKPGALVKVIVPYFRSPYACIDPTHKHYFSVSSFSFFDPDHAICQRYDYTLARFKIEKIAFNETIDDSLLKRCLVKIANKWPLKYEYYISHLCPLDDISYYLRRL